MFEFWNTNKFSSTIRTLTQDGISFNSLPFNPNLNITITLDKD